ncbi:hypothetical protein L2E82_51534 [Cichorium intybus]|nr:hypothetical protein L2E82_51534 [Cichorium intybus]
MWRQAVQCGSRAPTRPEPSIGHIVEKNDADHGAGSQAIPEVVCKKGISIEGWKFPSPGGVSALVHGLAKRADEMNWFRGMPAEINWESAASEFCFTLLYFISEFANKGTGGMFSRHKAWVGPFDPLGGKRVSWYGRTQKEERRVHHQSRKEKVGSAWQAQPLA